MKFFSMVLVNYEKIHLLKQQEVKNHHFEMSERIFR